MSTPLSRSEIVKILIVSAMLLVLNSHATGGNKPKVSVNLQSMGLHPRFQNHNGSRSCKFRSLVYRSVGWIDEHRVLVAFNSTPECSSTSGTFGGKLKIAVLDTSGKLERSIDLPYESEWIDRASLLVNGGVSMRRDGTAVVELKQLDLRSGRTLKLLVLSPELSVIQEVQPDSPATFADLTSDREGVAFWQSSRCRLYRGKPLRAVGDCSEKELLSESLLGKHVNSPFLEGYTTYDWSAADTGRVVVLGYKSNGICSDLGFFCPSDGMLFVFEVPDRSPVFKLKVSAAAAAALSPSGKNLAIMQRGLLEILPLP
jgi:hypothetical protein